MSGPSNAEDRLEWQIALLDDWIKRGELPRALGEWSGRRDDVRPASAESSPMSSQGCALEMNLTSRKRSTGEWKMRRPVRKAIKTSSAGGLNRPRSDQDYSGPQTRSQSAAANAGALAPPPPVADARADDASPPPPTPMDDESSAASNPPLRDASPEVEVATTQDTRRDVTALAWLRRQPSEQEKGDKAARVRPHRHKRMVDAALALGGPEIITHWRQLLRAWRAGREICEERRLDDINSSDMDRASAKRSWLMTLPEEEASAWIQFAAAWDRTYDNGVKRYLFPMLECKNLALLYGFHQAAVSNSMVVDDNIARGGQQHRQYIKDATFFRLYGTMEQAHPTERERLYRRLTNTLSRAKRWYMIQETLGAGMLALIPARLVGKTYLTQTLSETSFELWMELVRRFNPEAVALGTAALPWFTALAKGEAVPPYTLRLEHECAMREADVHRAIGWFDRANIDGELESRVASTPGCERVGVVPDMLEVDGANLYADLDFDSDVEEMVWN